MTIDIDYIKAFGYYISVNYDGEWLNNNQINKVLNMYSNFTYEELALKFGAYIDDSDNIDEFFFENLKDAEKIKNYLLALTR